MSFWKCAHLIRETVSDLVEACGLELRMTLAETDTGEASLLERNLRLSPAERLEQLRRTGPLT